MDAIIGFITDVTGEKRGPAKHYRRFNVLTEENQSIEGWIFANIDIDQTFAGNTLLTAAKNNSAVRLQGKLTTNSSNDFVFLK